ncbi:MAG: hypothetical protein HYY17_07910 [Planctomycetes bacterium]|nr:hypothetical protein [Planctomycetota bacterium]
MRRVKSRDREARAMAQRRANARARARNRPMPYPNPWDTWDPTKVPQDATPEQIHRSYLEFRKLCPPPPRKVYTI